MADEPNAGYMGKKLRKIEKRRRSREREKDRKTGRLNNQRALIGCRPREVAQWKRGGGGWMQGGQIRRTVEE